MTECIAKWISCSWLTAVTTPSTLLLLSLIQCQNRLQRGRCCKCVTPTRNYCCAQCTRDCVVRRNCRIYLLQLSANEGFIVELLVSPSVLYRHLASSLCWQFDSVIVVMPRIQSSKYKNKCLEPANCGNTLTGLQMSQPLLIEVNIQSFSVGILQ
jgi:hypothetical protein